MLAGLGVDATALEWSPRVWPRLVPIESVLAQVDDLAASGNRVVLWGHGRGAEAALLAAALDPRVDGVIALSPSDVVWQGAADAEQPDADPVSAWTWQGSPLPFVPRGASQDDSCRMHESARAQLDNDELARVSISVEQIEGDVLLVAGGADPVWPSYLAANSIEARRTRSGRATRVIFDSVAGHDVVLPAEIAAGRTVGPEDEAAAQLGRLARPAIRRMLGISDLA